jgi:hypothetical protein
MNLLGLITSLGRIADSLERIAFAQEALAMGGRSGNGLFSLKGGDGKDDSAITYVDDQVEWEGEWKRAEYAQRGNRKLRREEDIPSPDPETWR